MNRHGTIGILLLCLGLGGCLWDDQDPFSSHKRNGAIPPIEKLPKGTTEASSRLDSLVREIIAANPEITFRPQFFCIGVPEIAAYHQGTSAIIVSEGLISRCRTDSELAAVICSQLSQMAIEANSQGRLKQQSDREPPFAPRLHSDVAGSRGDPDQTGLAEQAYWQQRNPRRHATPPLEQDPEKLARSYMTSAKFTPDDVSKLAPLIRQAEANPVYSKTVTAP